MKNTKTFKQGDKVFAKIKGYPTWPAEVVSKEGKKFKVKFYGTGEIGVVKAEDICYYLKNKSSFLKSLKRKEYNDAVKEIEKAIAANGGTDGDTGATADSDPNSDSSLVENTSATKRVYKRKRSASQANIETANNKKKDNEAETALNKRTKTTKDDEEPEKVDENPPEAHENTLIENESEKEMTIESFLDESDTESYHINIIPDEYLQAVITYAEHLRKIALPEDKPTEERDELKNEVVVAKLPSGKFVALNYHQENTLNFTTEIKQADYEAEKAKKFLELKKSLEENTTTLDSHPEVSYVNLNLNENEVQQAIQMKLIERKKKKLKWLKIESNLVELDSKIKSSLGLDKAEPKQALEFLEQILELNMEPLMLIKHAHVVEMIRRLRRYIGNVKEWNLSEENVKTFQVHAENIRKKAEEVYDKIMDIMKVGKGSDFYVKFSDLCDEFRSQTKHLKENEVFALCSAPNSRRTFLDQLSEEEERKVINAEMNQSTDKESVSTVEAS